MSYAQNVLKGQQKHFGFMDVILLTSGHQHVSATHVSIFRAVRTSFQTFHFNSKWFTMHTISSLTNPVHTFMNYHFTFLNISTWTMFKNVSKQTVCIYIFICVCVYLFFIQPWTLPKTTWFFNCGVIYTHFNYTCFLVLTTLKMAT